MSRIGKLPISVPSSVNVTINEKKVIVEGSKGKLEINIHEQITLKQEGSLIHVSRKDTSKKSGAFQGLMRSLVANMIIGVTEGFEKKLEIVGIGYRVQAKGNVLDLTIGKSHPVLYEVPKELTVTVSDPTHFSISGSDKQLVGQVAANIRSLYPPEPYKGKGIRYEDEKVFRKAGKSVG